MTVRRLRWGALGAVAAFLVLAGSPGAGAAPTPPAGARAWLGHWDTNFGMLIFYDLSYTDVGWDSSGKEFSTCALNDCRHHWLLRGMWSWPEKPRQRKWVTIKGTPTGKGYDTVEPCWIGPFSLEVPSDTGDACYPMLLYRAGETERGGFWKACFLQELCTDHHHLSGHKTGPVWKAGFSFTQRGIPDGQRVIRTQTGGAGIILFDEAPVANRKGRGTRGRTTPGSQVFHIDEIPGGSNLSFSFQLKEGRYLIFGRKPSLVMAGVVTSSDDSHCHPGALIGVTITDGQRGGASQIRLSGCRAEQWTSADPNRVHVHLQRPQPVG